MTIIEAMKFHNLRVVVDCGNKWMYWDDIDEEWVVMEHRYRHKNSDILIKTVSEDKAVEELAK